MFTLIELLVVIAIIAILAALMFPALSKAKDNAKKIQCISNFRTLWSAFYAYSDEFKGFLPNIGYSSKWTGRGWYPQYFYASGFSNDGPPHLLYAYYIAKAKNKTDSQKRFVNSCLCPARQKAPPYGDWGGGWDCYATGGQNMVFTNNECRIFNAANPSRIAMVGESYQMATFISYFASMTDLEIVGFANRHLRTASVTFIDGHAESVSFTRFPLVNNPFVKFQVSDALQKNSYFWAGGPTTGASNF